VLCPLQSEETLEHLLLNRPFAVSCWNLLNPTVTSGEPFAVLLSFKVQLNLVFFMDIIIIMAWCIRMSRNDLISIGIQPRIQTAKERFKAEFALGILRAKISSTQAMSIWLQSVM
jgi:hypothetical protein